MLINCFSIYSRAYGIAYFIQIPHMANDVYYFNPTCELAVANGSFSYMPPRLLREFEQDCALLPFVFCNSSDIVLTENLPSPEFMNQLRDAGFDLPEFCPLVELNSQEKGSLGTIFPWGWSPAAHFKLKELKEKCTLPFQESPVYTWNEKHTALYERITSLEFLKKFLDENLLDFLIDQAMTGTRVVSIEEIEILLKKQHPLVLKAPLSSSGRGIQILRKPLLSTSNRQWISGILNQQNYLVAEPFLDKVADLSFQFTISDHGQPEYLGYSVFETNSNGQYKSSLIHPEIRNNGLSKFIKETKPLIDFITPRLSEALKNSVYAQLHRGFLGIDALVYKDHGGLKIQPCIEINSRMNMGILTMQIEKKVHEQTIGKFELFYGPRGAFQQFALKMAAENPIQMSSGKLSAGFLPLVEPHADKQFGAYVMLKGNPKN